MHAFPIISIEQWAGPQRTKKAEDKYAHVICHLRHSPLSQSNVSKHKKNAGQLNFNGTESVDQFSCEKRRYEPGQARPVYGVGSRRRFVTNQNRNASLQRALLPGPEPLFQILMHRKKGQQGRYTE